LRYQRQGSAEAREPLGQAQGGGYVIFVPLSNGFVRCADFIAKPIRVGKGARRSRVEFTPSGIARAESVT
jgi:hypothetical protein